MVDEIDMIAARLAEAIPGAQVLEVPSNPQERRFIVQGKNPRAAQRKDSQLAHGSTRREAVDRAVHLFGRSQR